MAQSQQEIESPGDAFDAAAFEQEIATVLHAMVDRIERIETAEYGVAQEAIATLKKADFSQAETLSDAHAMIDDMWEETMRKKYSPLRGLFAHDGPLADVATSVPTLLGLLGKAFGD